MLTERRSKPPYWVGIFCLIPLLGAFVGAGLIIAGLVKYKDRWMWIIGVAGILFTVLIYGSLFYAMKNSSIVKNGFAKISQMELNSLVKNIEFFKLQHGHYPDSLAQLSDDDKLAPISDPIQESQMNTNNNFNYERFGNKYTLFSSGVDGIPKTLDDLYPDIVISDTTKIGLVKLK